MKPAFEFLKTTSVNGFLILLPVGLAIVAIEELFDVAVLITQPIASYFSGNDLLSGTAIAVVLLFLLFFFVGFTARSRTGKYIGRWLEKTILEKLGIYSMLKHFTQQFNNNDDMEGYLPAVLTDGDTQVLVFIIEEHKNKRLTVFIPHAPMGVSGTVQCVSPERVRKLNVSRVDILDCQRYWGLGTKALLEQS